MKTLVAGWFSYWNGHATAGDILARDAVCEWLDAAGIDYDIALAAPFEGGVDVDAVDPDAYSHVVFVCGPFEQGELEARLLRRFGGCRLIGVNLSMAVPLEQWHPFDLLMERDSTRGANADIVFATKRPLVPVVGVCRVEPHPGAIDELANAAIDRLLASREAAIVEIDTRLDVNSTGLRTTSEVESLIARMDVVLTTRLHGMVLAVKNGVPVIAIDPIAGGAKIRRQAATIGWPHVFNADAIEDESLRTAFDYCLEGAARVEARHCAERAARMVESLRERFIDEIAQSALLEKRFEARRAAPPDDGWMAAHLAKESTEQASPRGQSERRSLVRRWAGKVYRRLALRQRDSSLRTRS